MISPELEEIFDETVREAIDQIPAVSMGFKGSGLDLKAHVDNEMDFYPCILVSGEVTLSIPENDDLKLAVMYVDPISNNHAGALINPTKNRDIDKNQQGLFLLN